MLPGRPAEAGAAPIADGGPASKGQGQWLLLVFRATGQVCSRLGEGWGEGRGWDRGPGPEQHAEVTLSQGLPLGRSTFIPRQETPVRP